MRKNTLALYLRSSVEQESSLRNKGNPDESDTIANQRRLLRAHILVKGLVDYDVVEYVDDGHSGVNFSRPAFQRLIMDVGKGLVQAIMVKDFSRMGRDYIGVGDYMEQYFPKMGVRVISINDNWDSDEHKGETMELDASFRTLLYDMYSRDLSKKRRTANQTRNKKGIYSGGQPPYGYQKDPEDLHHLVINPETAVTVKKIFALFLAGHKIPDICRMLTEEGIPTPSQANTEMYGYKTHTGIPNVGKWRVTSVSKILRNEVYAGTMILNRFKSEYGKGCRETDRSEWMYFPDRHEPIVSKEDFDRAQGLFPSRRRTGSITAGKSCPVYCGHCGAKFKVTTRTGRMLVCRNGIENVLSDCAEIQIRNSVLEQTLASVVKLQAALFLDWSGKQVVELNRTADEEKQIDRLDAEIKKYRDERLFLYGQYKDGGLAREDFLRKKQEYIGLEEECIAEKEAAEASLQEKKEKQRRILKSRDILQDAALMEGYDERLADALISKIEAFNDGRIKIHWKFTEEFPECASDTGNTSTLLKACGETVQPKAAVYSSELAYFSSGSGRNQAEKTALDYCRHVLGIAEPEISVYHDSRDEGGLFYKPSYMEMMAQARSGKLAYIVVGSLRELYLSAHDLYNLLFWILPKFPCCLVSVEDGYCSGKLEEVRDQEVREMLYEKYRGVRKSDEMRQRALERRRGERTAKPPTQAVCTLVYGYYRTPEGCFTDNEALETIRRIYRSALEGMKPIQIARKLNEEDIPTPYQFFRAHGDSRGKEKKHVWDGDKVEGILKNEKYVKECPYKRICRSEGKHCGRKPFILKDDYQKALKQCRHWQSRKKKADANGDIGDETVSKE